MTYPNAYSGVKKVFTAQIIMLISVILAFISAIISSGFIPNDSSVEAAGQSMLAIIGTIALIVGVVSIIAFIINLVGLSQAGEDESNFKTAFILTLLALVFSIIQSVLSNNVRTEAGGICGVVGEILQFLVILYVILGIISLGSKLNNEKLMKRGRSLLTLIAIFLIIGIVINVITSFVLVNPSENTLVILGVVAIIGGLLRVIAYIVYLTLLAKATKALKE